MSGAEAALRERRLQRCRERFRKALEYASAVPPLDLKPWDGEDFAELDWVDRLAASGHVGAQRVLGRLLRDTSRIEELHRLAPGQLAALAGRWPRPALFLARLELARPQPDLAALERWLKLAATSTLHLEHTLQPLLEQAKLRLGSSAAGASGIGQSLLELAASLGASEAEDLLWTAAYDAAADKEAFLREWFAGHKPTELTARPCLGIGAAYERRGDLAGAVQWYERSSRRPGWRKDRPDVLDMEFCHAVANAFNGRSRTHLVDDLELCMAWRERALELGDERCMDDWLKAYAAGASSDPDVAMERAKRYCASGVDLEKRRWRLGSSLRAVLAQAKADPPNAEKWLAVAELLGEKIVRTPKA